MAKVNIFIILNVECIIMVFATLCETKIKTSLYLKHKEYWLQKCFILYVIFSSNMKCTSKCWNALRQRTCKF